MKIDEIAASTNPGLLKSTKSNKIMWKPQKSMKIDEIAASWDRVKVSKGAGPRCPSHRVIESSSSRSSAAEAVACKSAAVRSAPLVGVLGPRVQKPRLKSLFLLRTDKVSSLGACTHRLYLKVTRTK
jgi:hypothetical protein